VIDHWWQTELGWPGVATCFAMGDTRRKPGSAGFPCRAMNLPSWAMTASRWAANNRALWRSGAAAAGGLPHAVEQQGGVGQELCRFPRLV
jgi:hypothetical protein